MAKRRRSGNSIPPVDWINTYADLVTLLLTFFVMLFAMSTIDKIKFERVSESIRNAFTFQQSGGGGLLETNRGTQIDRIYDELNAVDSLVALINSNLEQGNVYDYNLDSEYHIDDLKEEISLTIQEMDLQDDVQIIDETNFIILRFDSVLLFDLGKADIRPSSIDTLKKIGSMLNKLNNQIIVQGHTDDLPINTVQFPSNWELSTRRATNVVRFLIDECGIDPRRLTATGNAEFKPVKPNDNSENRQQNRRIDIVISKQ